MAKIGRNEACWCGSGEKYKNCHLGRADEQRRPFRAIESELRRAAAFRTCLHPEASKATCGKIISAHTLQRSRVLAEIADSNNKVLTYFPAQHTDAGRLRVHRKGWKESSTFTAFCGKHDDETFAPLEKFAFEGTPEQIFLTSYRAVCWELYQKQSVINGSPVVRKNVDRGTPENLQRRAQAILAAQDAGFVRGLAGLKRLKAHLDLALLNSDFDILESVEFGLDGPLAIASTGVITPNKTLSGQHLQTLHDEHNPLQWLALGVNIRESGPTAIFAWFKEQLAPKRYLEEVLSLAPEDRATFLAQFYFAHCENTYFSEVWWSSLSESQQRHIEELARNSNPYYFLPQYKLHERSLSPWRSAIVIS